MDWTASAPGKIILFGEHAVIYGHRALAVAIDRYTHVTLRERPGPSGVDGLEGAGPVDPRLQQALRTLLPAEGLGVSISGDLPIGRGLGSSASFAVALVRALAAREGRSADVDECDERGMLVERVFHGTPSGVDHAVVARGGGVLFRRDPAGGRPVLTRVRLPPLPLVVIDSGSPGNTARLVAAVAARRPDVDPVLHAIGRLVEQVAGGVVPGPSLGALMQRNHALLCQLGVSTPELDRIARLALDAGAWGAKLAGSGGGGVVVALAPEPERIVERMAAEGLGAFSARVVAG